MKNVLTYFSPTKSFNNCDVLAKIQIDNSLSLGWKPEDILLVTNFPYEYNGVKAIVVGDEHICAVRPRSNNTTIVPHLIDLGLIGDDIGWVHDFDAYQAHPIENAELGMENVDAGFTDYGWRANWCLGSFFFKKESRDIFEKLKRVINTNIEDEIAFIAMTQNNEDNINARIKRMDITYDFGMRHTESNFKKAIKPLRVLHFHPVYKGARIIDSFMHGKNGWGVPYMPQRLIEIFKQYDIQ